jgi:hypothetical protein
MPKTLVDKVLMVFELFFGAKLFVTIAALKPNRLGTLMTRHQALAGKEFGALFALQVQVHGLHVGLSRRHCEPDKIAVRTPAVILRMLSSNVLFQLQPVREGRVAFVASRIALWQAAQLLMSAAERCVAKNSTTMWTCTIL